HRHAGGQLAGSERDLAAEVGAAHRDQRRHPSTFGHADRLAFLRVDRDLRDGQRRDRLDGRELDAVAVRFAALAEEVLDADDVLPVLAEAESEGTVAGTHLAVASYGSAR